MGRVATPSVLAAVSRRRPAGHDRLVNIDVAAVEAADRVTYPQRLQTIEAASADIPGGEATVLDAIYELIDARGRVRGADVAAHLDQDPPQIATAAQRLKRRAAIRRERGLWRFEHRLLHRYRTTAGIV